ncbi:MAG: transposase domain-containing protein [Chlamydiota bacterium]
MNAAKRAIRPVAIGRKNWIFFGSKEGEKAGGTLLSLIQTCRRLGVNPREYLEDILKRIMTHPAKKVAELLPDRWLLDQKNQE